MNGKSGIGDYQIKEENKAIKKIVGCLIDGEWHRYHDIQAATRLSPATLSKHLKKLGKIMLEKNVDVKSGEYPYPAYYRLDDFARGRVTILKSLEKIMAKGAYMVEKKQPRFYLHNLNAALGTGLLKILEKTLHEVTDEKELDMIIEVLILWNFETYVRLFVSQLRELAKEGIDWKTILKESVEQYLDDYEALASAAAKKDASLKQIVKEMDEFFKGEGVET